MFIDNVPIQDCDYGSFITAKNYLEAVDKDNYNPYESTISSSVSYLTEKTYLSSANLIQSQSKSKYFSKKCVYSNVEYTMIDSLSSSKKNDNFNFTLNQSIKNKANDVNLWLKPIKQSKLLLMEIIKLKDNWNGNGAKHFPDELITKVSNILDELQYEPFVCPVAYGSIQLEYEKDNGEYLEFEVYENEVKVFAINSDGDETECNLNNDCDIVNDIKKMVANFYE